MVHLAFGGRIRGGSEYDNAWIEGGGEANN